MTFTAENQCLTTTYSKIFKRKQMQKLSPFIINQACHIINRQIQIINHNHEWAAPETTVQMDNREVSTAHSHVWPTSGLLCASDGIDQVAADPKVADLHLTSLVDEDVGRLDISVNHFQFGVQVVKGLYHL